MRWVRHGASWCLELLRDPPVLLGVVGGVVHDVVRQDHRGEDGVSADKAGAKSVGRSSRVGRRVTPNSHFSVCSIAL